MRTITVPLHDRPEYVLQFLETLRKNDLSGYKLFLNVEPSVGVFEDIIQRIDWIEKDVQWNEEKLGPAGNPLSLIDRAFTAGSEFNIHFDSDLVLAPDALNLANWYFENFKNHPLKYIVYSLFNYGSDPHRPEMIQELPEYFMGLGWCIYPAHWEIFKEIWLDNILSRKWFTPQTEGWDWELSGYAKEHHLNCLIPAYSRTNHIGRCGTYCDEAWQQKAFDNLKWNRDGVYRNFYLQGAE